MTTLVFGHKSPDTDATLSAIIWAWYLTNLQGVDAKAVLLGEPNTEAAFVLRHWGFAKPEIIADVSATDHVVIVDTNNPAELPPSINEATIMAIIDHHMLVGGLKSKTPINVVLRPLACTATVMHDIIGADMAKLPREIKGAMLSCILSDTLEFRSPTTTAHDQAVAEALAADLGVAAADGADQVLLFVIDILREEATLLVPNDLVRQMAEASFGVKVIGDTVVLPGVMSRKKQIIPSLKL